MSIEILELALLRIAQRERAKDPTPENPIRLWMMDLCTELAAELASMQGPMEPEPATPPDPPRLPPAAAALRAEVA